MDNEEKMLPEGKMYEPYASAERGGGVLEVREPPIYYGDVCGGGVADAEVGEAPESITVRTLGELYAKVDEGRADLLAGRMYLLDDVCGEIERDIENGTI